MNLNLVYMHAFYSDLHLSFDFIRKRLKQSKVNVNLVYILGCWNLRHVFFKRKCSLPVTSKNWRGRLMNLWCYYNYTHTRIVWLALTSVSICIRNKFKLGIQNRKLSKVWRLLPCLVLKNIMTFCKYNYLTFDGHSSFILFCSFVDSKTDSYMINTQSLHE